MSYPSQINLGVTIEGTNIENSVANGYVRIINRLGQRTDTCRFWLDNPATTDIPNDWDEVIVYDGASKLFGGYVLTDESERDQGSFRLMHRVDCVDFSIMFEKVFVKAEYEDKTDAYIINDIVTDNDQLTGFDGATDVDAIKTWDRVRFNRKTLFQVMDYLADGAQAHWYVDEDKAIHFYATEENSAPFNLSDDPDMALTFPFAKLKKRTDGTQVVNRIVVVGGDYRSGDVTFREKGTGKDPHITIPYRMYAPSPTTDTSILVWRNDGTEGTPVWTPLTVKVKHIDSLSSTDDVLYNYQEKVLEQTDNWPALENAVKVTGQYEIPLRVKRRDAASYAHYGKWFDGKIVDDTIITKAVAKLTAKAELAKKSMATVVLECEVLEPGLKSGQIIQITDTPQGLTAQDYIIHKVITETNMGGFSESLVELGTYEPDIIDIILKLVRSTTGQILWRDDEVLDEIFDTDEDMTIDEGTPALSVTQPPYYWGATTDNEMQWDFFTWSDYIMGSKTIPEVAISGHYSGGITYIFSETSQYNGYISQIQVYSGATPPTFQFAIFDRSVNDFTDSHWKEDFTLVEGLNTLVEGVDYAADAFPIDIGQYFGWYGGNIWFSYNVYAGYLYDSGDQIGDGAASTFDTTFESSWKIAQIRITIR